MCHAASVIRRADRWALAFDHLGQRRASTPATGVTLRSPLCSRQRSARCEIFSRPTVLDPERQRMTPRARPCLRAVTTPRMVSMGSWWAPVLQLGAHSVGVQQSLVRIPRNIAPATRSFFHCSALSSNCPPHHSLGRGEVSVF
jgi:hypothetical protein